MPLRGDRPGGRTGTRSPALLVGVAVTLGLALLAAAVRPPWQLVSRDFGVRPDGGPPPAPVQAPSPPSGSASPLPPPTGEPFVLPPWIKWVVLAIVVAVVGWLIVRWLRRRLALVADRPVADDELIDVVPELPVLQRGAEEAERHLIAGGNPTDAIVAAWMALEEAAESSGVARRPAQTPTEFTADVLNRTGVEPGSVQTLLRLYLRARFAASGAGPADLESARRSIRALASSWRSFAGYGPAERDDGPDAGGRP